MITAAPRARPGRWRRRAFALLTVLLVLLLLAVGLEVGFRCCWTPPMPEFQQAGLYVQEPDGGFGLLPGYRGTLQVRADLPPTEVAINALGLRGPEIGPRVPGERRVLCVGDSMVFGYGVDAAAAFPAQLQQQLSRQLAAVVTVGNAGVPSYGTVEAARQLRRMLGRFHADAAVFCIY
ncbi:MAG TPA: SGNH/GDSL hydrolase family protein, partial [Planctomycetota bacterium]|nr:SGNH/GDSL hydrolase family protein [Planctomycetota bacterium]